MKEINTFIDPQYRFITFVNNRSYFMSDGCSVRFIFTFIRCWKEEENPRHTFQHHFIIFFIKSIENNISNVYVTNDEGQWEMPTKEIRDPIYNFIHINPYEKNLMDTDYFRRLKYIRQLGLTYNVYPGAEHTRFEHSLGTMEIATRVFDILKNKKYKNKNLFNKIFGTEIKKYRQILRVASLLHDIGHYPFSHSSEDIWKKNHEEMGNDIILDKDFRKKIEDEKLSGFKIKAEDVAFIIVDSKDKKGPYDAKLKILKDILTGDLGVDRIDYLIRDSIHLGVSYGIFDYHRLIDTLILLLTREKDPDVGIELGGIQSAEGLILARYFMFTQVYYHKTRVAFDLHLIDYLKEFVKYSDKEKNIDFSKLNDFKYLTDYKILHQIELDAKDLKSTRNKYAKILFERNHHELAETIIGTKIGLAKFSPGKELKPIFSAITNEVKTNIEDEYPKEFKNGEIKIFSKEKKTDKFIEKFFSVYDEGNVKNILFHSDIIGNLKNMDLLYVYTSRGNDAIKMGVGKIVKNIKKEWDIV